MALPSNFFSSQSILVIDDIDTIRSAIKGMLQMLGCNDITIANNGERALELCGRRKYDFILCDFNLGKGKDGYQFFEELKLRFMMKPNTVFILISAEKSLQVVHGLLELQPDDYLLKPFSYKTLEVRLVRAVDRRKALGAIYERLAVKDYINALSECTIAAQLHKDYNLTITRIKGEVLINLQQPQAAFDLYESILVIRDFSWALLGKAIAYYHLQDHRNAETILNELCERPETRIEALNWLASIYAERESYAQAKAVLIESVRLSPKNIPRQRALANLSVLGGDWVVAGRCLKNVLDNTRFSVHEHINHHFNYIHCLLENVQGSNELQQAKVFAQVQPIIKNAFHRFDKIRFAELEKIVVARMMAYKGSLKLAIETISNCDREVVIDCGRDSALALAKVWFELGNCEKHDEIIDLIEPLKNDNSIEAISDRLFVTKLKVENKLQINRLLDLNTKGVALYKSGLYPVSSSVFLEASEIMPNHLPLALNLAQSITKGWPSNVPFNKKKKVAKNCINVIEANQLDELSTKRYRSIEMQLKAIR